MYKIVSRYIFCVIVLVALTFNIYAQQDGVDKKKYSKDLLKLVNPWLSTNNPAAIYLFDEAKISVATVGFRGIDGEFNRSMDASEINQFYTGTYSYNKRKNISIFGQFEYINSQEKNVKWADVMNPYYEENPFVLGDSIGGDYKKELFHMGVGFATKLKNDNFLIGIALDYLGGIGGKDIDPRPLNKIMKLEINPGIVYTANNYSFGFNFFYKYNKEDIEIKSFANDLKYNTYKFKGFGLYVNEVEFPFYRYYYNNIYGINAQFGFTGTRFENITEIGFSYINQDVEDNRNEVKEFAVFEVEKFSLSSLFKYKGDNLIHILDINAELKNKLGSGAIVNSVNNAIGDSYKTYGYNKNYTHDSKSVSFEYSIHKLNEKNYRNWKAMVKVDYLDSSKEYKYDPVTFNDEYRNIDITTEFEKTIDITDKSVLLVNVHGGYRYNLDNKLYVLDENNKSEFLIENIDEFIVSDIVKNDNEWASANIIKYGGSIKYSFDTNWKNKVNATYLKLEFQASKINTGYFKGENRNMITAACGVVF